MLPVCPGLPRPAAYQERTGSLHSPCLPLHSTPGTGMAAPGRHRPSLPAVVSPTTVLPFPRLQRRLSFPSKASLTRQGENGYAFQKRYPVTCPCY